MEGVDVFYDEPHESGTHPEDDRADGGQGEADRAPTHSLRPVRQATRTMPDEWPKGVSGAVVPLRCFALTSTTIWGERT